MASRASRVGKGSKRSSCFRPCIRLGCILTRLTPLLIAVVILSPLLAAEDRRFHADEAFFMTFAREAAVKGDWWLTGPLDKPPLTIYAHATLLALIGTDTLPNGVLTLKAHKGEFVGRLLAFFSSLAALALVMRLTLDLTQLPLAAVGAAFSLTALPLYQLYSASAFMDVPMMALALGALLAARRQQASASGVLLGLAICAKPQAALFAPLVGWYVLRVRRPWLLMRWGAGVSGALMALWLWDALRPGDSVILLGAANNDNFTPMIRPAALLERLRAWLPLDHHDHPLREGGMLTWALLTSAGLLSRRARPISLWLLAYSVGHLLIFEALYERYLLPVAILGGIAALTAATDWGRSAHSAFLLRRVVCYLMSGLLLAGLGAWLGIAANSASCAVGGAHACRPLWMLDDDRHDSPIMRIAADVNALPVATVVYDHWLGWLLNYYMGPWHDKRIVYYPSPDALIAGIRALEERGPRYFLILTRDFAQYGLSSAWSSDGAAWRHGLMSAFPVDVAQTYGTVELLRIVLD